MSNTNGADLALQEAHEDRIQNLEKIASDYGRQIERISAQIDFLAESLKKWGEQITKAMEISTAAIATITATMSAQSERLAVIERAEDVRTKRKVFLRKAAMATVLAATGAAATKLLAVMRWPF